MRVRLTFVVAILFLASTLSAKDVYLSVGGSVGNFRTDARIFNPSFDKDITVTARYLPAGNVNNEAVAPKTITVAKRSMAVYNDVVQSLFGGGAALGAVRLTSDDDFVATQRIYADEAIGTLGQFVPGLDVSTALKKGVLIQLKQSPAGSSGKGTFRTNWGGVNPNAAMANVTFTLYDKSNTVAGTNTLNIQPFGVVAPTNIAGFFGSPNRDLTDSWISFTSDQPIFAYGSIVDNASADPTFITASHDSGVEQAPPPPKTVTVNARDFVFDISGEETLRAGDTVTFRISKNEGTHGFVLQAPNGSVIINMPSMTTTVVERTVTLPTAGNYFYACTNSLCGSGHTIMTGEFTVQP
jgi:heme/copper-type cytochrome/quinol oxidase subunit 2